MVECSHHGQTRDKGQPGGSSRRHLDTAGPGRRPSPPPSTAEAQARRAGGPDHAFDADRRRGSAGPPGATADPSRLLTERPFRLAGDSEFKLAGDFSVGRRLGKLGIVLPKPQPPSRSCRDGRWAAFRGRGREGRRRIRDGREASAAMLTSSAKRGREGLRAHQVSRLSPRDSRFLSEPIPGKTLRAQTAVKPPGRGRERLHGGFTTRRQ